MRTAVESRRSSACYIGVAAVLLLVVGCLFLFRTVREVPNAQASVAPEHLRAELHLRDGRLYHNADTNAFTGWMVERYVDGSLRSRSAISNGVLHGLSEGWHTNGNLQITEQFREGVSHGRRTKWLTDGVKQSEADIVEGKFQGTFRKWHRNGMLSEEVEFVDNQPSGNALAYYPSGSLKSLATLERGKIVDQKFWNDGESRAATMEGAKTAATPASL